MSHESESPLITWVPTPSAQTMFRLRLLGAAAHDRIGLQVARTHPEALARDRHKIERIQQARTPTEVLDLAPFSSGLAEREWNQRVQALGAAVVPQIATHLARAQARYAEPERSLIYERLLGALALHGAAGATVATEVFDELDDYGKSLACIVLGHLGASDSADRLWAFFQHAERNSEESFFVGPLWGLVDLEDPRAADALARLLWDGYFFYAAPAMAYAAGDRRVIIPLLVAFGQEDEQLKAFAAWALVGVAHRVGRAAMLAELEALDDVPPGEREALADQWLALSAQDAYQLFAAFFEGMSPDIAEQLLDEGGARGQGFAWGPK